MTSDRYAVVGHPVEHSQSPFIHAMFAQATGQCIDYGRLLAPLDAFADTTRQFAAEGARGCNVTVPFKFEAFKLASCRSERAELARAANTLRFDEGGWFADNTDGAGLRRDIEQNAGVSLSGQRVLLIGAGGAASGVMGPLIDANPSVLILVNRTPDKAALLVKRHEAMAKARGVALHTAPLNAPGRDYQVVINATASSLTGSAVPVDANVLAPGALALDMMYGAAANGFLSWARAHGAVARDGLGMLVEQAAEAFFVWRNLRPDTQPVLAALRARVENAA